MSNIDRDKGRKMLVTKLSRCAVLTLLLVFADAPPALAQTGEHESASTHEATHEFHPNLLALFVGGAYEGSRENGFALGIEYERRLNRFFGIGVVAEYTFGDLDAWVYAVPCAYHSGRWKFYVAPGVENGEHGSESLVRIGGEYAFEVGAWEISPQLDVDFVDGEEVYVLGVTFGKGF
jgi:hypothetical protein